MKITDESVAKALGWTERQVTKSRWQWMPPKDQPYKYPLDYWPPAFTTSLDAIVAEIEARGLVWQVRQIKGGFFADVIFYENSIPERCGVAENKTAPLALCAALLAFLKSKE